MLIINLKQEELEISLKDECCVGNGKQYAVESKQYANIQNAQH